MRVLESGNGAPRVALNPEDWFAATWRELPPLPRPAAPPFDPAAAAARIEKLKEYDYFSGWNWGAARLPLAPKPAEARFWLAAMATVGREAETQKAAAKMARWQDAPLTLSGAIDALRRDGDGFSAAVWIPLLALFPTEEVVRQVLDHDAAARAELQRQWSFPTWAGLTALGTGFRRYARPYLTFDEVARLRELVRPHFDPRGWSAASATPLPLRFGAALGLHDEVRGLVEGWPEMPTAHDVQHAHALEMVYGLGHPDEVREQVRRLGLKPQDGADVRGWLAHTEWNALEWPLAAVLAQKRKGGAEPLARALALVQAPEAAAPMLTVLLKSAAPEIGRAWLERHPAHAAAGLAPLAAGGRGQVAQEALEVLRRFVREGKADLVAEAVARVEGPAGHRLHAALFDPAEDPHPPLDDAAAPPWLPEAVADLKPKDAPKWLTAADLPPILLGDRRLAEEQVTLLLVALRRSELGKPHLLVEALREHADAPSLDRFAERLLERWQREGIRFREKWALEAAAQLGGDGCALQLGPLAKTWREKLRHQHAGLALDCLRALGSDMALLQLHNFTQVPREWSLKETAELYLAEAAEARGPTREELEDRMVPACGLDERGERLFDTGGRQFRFVLGPELRPLLREGSAKPRPDFPRPGPKDDRARAETGAAEWKLLKKQVAEVLKRQARRLELAMVAGRRWEREVWQRLIGHLPLMTHLARLLVWGVDDGAGGFDATFRVAEDGSWADGEDAAFRLPDNCRVGLPHPLQLADAERARWGGLFSDYELVSPFPQLGRPIYRVTPEEASADRLRRFDGVPMLAIAVVSGLEARGWRRDLPGDGGHIAHQRRAFPAAQLTAIVDHDPGIAVWDKVGSEPQTFDGCRFLRGSSLEQWWMEQPLPLGEVDPIAFSEVAYDLAALTTRR